MPALDLERLGRYESVYVSPHVDDAVLSCTGRILWERERGLKVLVLALFEDTESESPAAFARLGVDYVAAGLPPAVRRRPSETSFRALAFDPRPEDEDWRHRTARLLNDLVPWVRPRHVYAPLGVGGHIDHRLVHEAALQAYADKPGRNVFFYEERPEAVVPGAVRMRLGLLGARLPPGAAQAAETAGLTRYLLRFHLAPALRGDLRGWRRQRGHRPGRARGPLAPERDAPPLGRPAGRTALCVCAPAGNDRLRRALLAAPAVPRRHRPTGAAGRCRGVAVPATLALAYAGGTASHSGLAARTAQRSGSCSQRVFR
jgi:LmbE family N-acetylglucosaminyl deacetylase